MNLLEQALVESLLEALRQFHFIRPYSLLAILPGLLMSFLLYRIEKHRNAWQQHIDPVLLTPLLVGKIKRSGNKLPLFTLLFWLIAAVALAGPTWQKLPTPIEKRDSALVIMLDLSPSMLAKDVQPSRLVAARHKILDLLTLRREGYTALIAYSGDAHVVSPLTDDTKTIASLLQVLEPGIMPAYGSNLEDALSKALLLFKNAGYTQGDILLVTDGVTEQTVSQSVPLLQGKPFTLFIIGVGSEQGAPIPDNAGGFLKDDKGAIILPQLHEDKLRKLAKQLGGYYSHLQLNDGDIQALIDGTRVFNQTLTEKDKTKKIQREFDQWRDVGGILCLGLLPILLVAFRRGIIISLLLILPLIHSPQTQAEDNAQSPAASTKHSKWQEGWDSLWLNANQRAKKAMNNKDYESAAKQFTDPDWKAAALYHAGDYRSALKQFQSRSSADDIYNQGNALAKSGQLQEAIKAYNEVLKKNPKFDDATFNKKIVEDLLKQQEQQSAENKPQEQASNNSQEQPSANDPSQSLSNDDKPDQDTDESKKDKSAGQQQADNAEENAGRPDQQNRDGEANRDQQQKAHEEKDASQSDIEAQMEKSDAGADKPEPSAESQLTAEDKQALEQWLRQVPDDPSGLLRNKFEYYYQQRLQNQDVGKNDQRLNNEERW